MPLVQLDEVVEVAADLHDGVVHGAELQVGVVWGVLGDHTPLYLGGVLELSLVAFGGEGFLVEAGVDDGGGGLGGQGFQ